MQYQEYTKETLNERMNANEVKIAALEAEIAELQTERRAATAPEERIVLGNMITEKQRTLNILMTQSGNLPTVISIIRLYFICGTNVIVSIVY